MVAYVLADVSRATFHRQIVRTRPLSVRHLFAAADVDVPGAEVLLCVNCGELHEPGEDSRTRSLDGVGVTPAASGGRDTPETGATTPGRRIRIRPAAYRTRMASGRDLTERRELP